MRLTLWPYRIITLVMVVSLLFSNKLNSLCIILLCLTWLAERNFTAKFRQLAREPFFLLNGLLFLLYLLSIALSDDRHTAWFFVEKNLSLLVLPMVLLSRKPFSETALFQFCKAFVAGACLLMLYATAGAVAAFFHSQDPAVFFYHNLAGKAGMFAIMASLLCSTALALVLYIPLPGRLRVAAACALSLWIVLLASKMFLLVLVLLLAANAWPRAGRRLRVFMIVLPVLLALLVVFTDNPLRKRFADLAHFRSGYLTAADFNEGIYFDGLSLRLVFIRFGLAIVQEDGNYLLGAGTGDAEQLLRDKVKQYHMYTGNGADDREGYLQYGFHNELLQKYVQLGLTGLLVFLSAFGYVVYMAVRHRDRLLAGLAIIFGCSFFTDTLPEQQTGLVIFLVFTCFALCRIRQAAVTAAPAGCSSHSAYK